MQNIQDSGWSRVANQVVENLTNSLIIQQFPSLILVASIEVASVINLSQVLRACFKFTLPSLIDTLGTGILVARAALAFSKAGRYVRRRHNRLTGWSDQFSRQYSEKFFCEKCANFLGFLCKESFRDSPAKSSGKWRAASYFKGKALTFASVVERIFHITGLLPDTKNKVGNFKPSDSQRSEIFMNKG